MFHWICPECGREIPPSVKECAACDPRAQAAPAQAVPEPVPAAPALIDVKTNVAPPVKEPQVEVIAAPTRTRTAKPVPAPAVIDVKAIVTPPAADVRAELRAEVKAAPVAVETVQPEPVAFAPIGLKTNGVPPLPENPVEAKASPLPAQVARLVTPAPKEAKANADAEPVEAPVEKKGAYAPVEPLKSEPVAPVEGKTNDAAPAREPLAEMKSTPAPVAAAKPLQVVLPRLEIGGATDAPSAAEPAPWAATPPSGPIDAKPAVKEPEPPPDPLLELAEHIREAQSGPRASVEAPPLPVVAPVAAPVIAPAAVEAAPLPAPPTAPAPPAVEAKRAEQPTIKPAEPEPAAEEPRAPEVQAPSLRPALAELAAAVNAAEEALAERPPAPAPVEPEISLAAFFPEPRPVAASSPAQAPAAFDVRNLAANPAVEPAESEPARPDPTTQFVPPPILKPLVAPLESIPEEKPPSGSWLQLAPLQDYTLIAGRSMHPAAPNKGIAARDDGPKMTLPGPALPPQLVKLQDAGVVTFLGEQRRSSLRLPGWMISGLLMLGIPIAGGALLLYFQPLDHSSAAAKAPAAAVEAVAPAPAPAAPAAASHSLADFVEVTGFRFLVDYNKKSEIHYLVVNHSGAALADMTLYVTLHAAGAKPGQPPLCRFSFRAPTLGPFESREMTSPIEKVSKAVSLPDWQDLRADVQIGQ